MDRVELKAADIDRLLEWRDQHLDEVRSSPAPLKAVELVFPHNGFRLKGIRDGGTLKLHLSQNGQQLGKCKFVQTNDGMWEITKNSMTISRDDLQSCLTVYGSLMALMAYGTPVENEVTEARKSIAHKPNKSHSRKHKKRTTYILRTVNGTFLAAPRGSHASPNGSFSVRGHYRHYKSGKVVWIAEYTKGKGKKKPKTYKIGGEIDGSIQA